jgi:2-hydroxychromene-2-carboxylate isomerase
MLAAGDGRQEIRMPRRPVLEFWYEFASAYSYLAAARVEALAEAAGVSVRWRPFLLGPIFAAQGWTSSPFNLFPAKGRAMWRDVEREAARLGLPPVTRPEPFPQNTLTAARIAVYGAEADWIAPFTKAVFASSFARGRSIAEPAAIAAILAELGLDPDIPKLAIAEPNKTRLRAIGEEAKSRGLFGAPTFVTEDGELFWGNDRLEQALAWAAGERPTGLL